MNRKVIKNCLKNGLKHYYNKYKMAKITAASFFLGLGIAMWGISLIYDPWS